MVNNLSKYFFYAEIVIAFLPIAYYIYSLQKACLDECTDLTDKPIHSSIISADIKFNGAYSVSIANSDTMIIRFTIVLEEKSPLIIDKCVIMKERNSTKGTVILKNHAYKFTLGKCPC